MKTCIGPNDIALRSSWIAKSKTQADGFANPSGAVYNIIWTVTKLCFLNCHILLPNTENMKTIPKSSNLLFIILLLNVLPLLTANVSSAIKPVVEIIGNTSGKEGEELAYDGSSSSDPDGKGIKSYNWTFGDGGRDSGSTVVHTYFDNGVYTVTLTVTDNDDETNTHTIDINIDNVKPNINRQNFSVSPTNLNEGSSITCDVIASDPGDDNLTYWWDFGDGKKAIGKSVNHKYDNDGSYIVTLTVTDGDGGSDEETQEVTVNNIAPTIIDEKFSVLPTTPNEGEKIECKAEASDPGDDILTYEWDFGDGNTSVEQNPRHIYTDDGQYNVILIVKDDKAESKPKERKITVTNVAPTIDEFNVLPVILKEGGSIDCKADASDPGDDIFIYEWDFGDGNFANGSSVSHVYFDDGLYIVELTVNDGDGDSDRKSRTIMVESISPGFIVYPTELDEGGRVTCDAPTFDDVNDELIYSWKFGDGKNDAGGSVNHVYVNDGAYDIELEIKTNDNKIIGRKTEKVKVRNVKPSVDVGPDLPKFDTSKPYKTGINVDESVQFRGTFTDPGMDTYEITWDFGDGNRSTPLKQDVPRAYLQDSPYISEEEKHEYSSSGFYTVILTVKDDDEESNDKLTVKIEKPANLKTEIYFENTEINEGENIIYEGEEIIVRMEVRNEGEAMAVGVEPSLKRADTSTGKATMVNGPIPPVSNIAGGSQSVFKWKYTTKEGDAGEIVFSGEVTGEDGNSGRFFNPKVKEQTVQVNIPKECNNTLTSKLSVEPRLVSIGQEFKVIITVTNTRKVAAVNVSSSLLLLEVKGDGWAILRDEPPASPEIPPGLSEEYPWIFQAKSAGTIFFRGRALGKDGNNPNKIVCSDYISEVVIIQTPATLKSEIGLYTQIGNEEKAVKEISSGQEIIARLIVTNEGEASVIIDTPNPPLPPNIKGIQLQDKLEKKRIEILSRSRQIFEWKYETTEESANQQVTFTATVTGKDKNSLQPKSAKATALLDIKTPMKLAVTNMAVEPNPVSEGQEVTIVMTVENIGGVDAIVVTPTLKIVPEDSNLIIPQENPPQKDIPVQESQNFTWRLNTQENSNGEYTFKGSAIGTDALSRKEIPSEEFTSDEKLTVHIPAFLTIQSIAIDSKPKIREGRISAGQEVFVTITVRNEGQTLASEVESLLEPSLPDKLFNPISPGKQNIPGGQTSLPFTWQYSTDSGSASTLTFLASTKGKDGNSQADIVTPNTKISEPLHIQRPTELSAHINIFDEKEKTVKEISAGQRITVKVTATNEGEAKAVGVQPNLEVNPNKGITLIPNSKSEMTDIIGNGSHIFEWTYQTGQDSAGQEVIFNATIEGKDENSQLEKETATADPFTLTINPKTNLLITQLEINPNQISCGQDVVVIMPVKNQGGAKALNVKPLLRLKPEDRDIIPPDQPTPPSADISPDGTQNYKWTYKTQLGSKGKYTFTGTASGEDENSGEEVPADKFTSGELTIQTPAELAIESIVVLDPDISYGQEIEVVMKVQNHGEADAEQVEPQLTLVQVIGSQNIQIISEPNTGVIIAGNSSREFVWKYSTAEGSEGQIRFEGKVTGRDFNSKKNIPSSQGISNDVFIEIPAGLTANVNAFEEDNPNSQTITEGQRITVIMIVENEGEAIAEDIKLSVSTSTSIATVSLHSSPEKLPDKIKKGTVGPFEWVYDTKLGSAGKISFSGNITGKDENSGKPVDVDFDPEVSPSITIQITPDIHATKIDVEEELIGINQSFDVIVSIINNGNATANIEPTPSDLNISPPEYSITPPASITLYGGRETKLIYNVETVEGETKSGTVSITVKKLTVIDVNSGKNIDRFQSDVKKEITVDMDRLKLVSALYVDANEDEKIGSEDKLFLTFDEPVKLESADETDFILFPGEFSLKSRPTIDIDDDDNRKVIITLRGDESQLTTEYIEGIYQTDKGAIGIGVYVKQEHLTDLAGNEPSRTESSDAVDVAIEDKQPPRITGLSLDKEWINTKPRIHLHVTDDNPGLNSGIADPGKDFEYLLDGKALTFDSDIKVYSERLQGDKEMEVKVEFLTSPVGRAHQFTVVAKDKQGNEIQKTITFEVDKSPIVDLATYPNPFAPGQMVGGEEGTVIRYVLNQRMNVDINIYDVAGHLVWKYKDVGQEGINDRVRWDGKTEGGDVVANGIYICELVTGEHRKYWRIAVVSMIKNRR